MKRDAGVVLILEKPLIVSERTADIKSLSMKNSKLLFFSLFLNLMLLISCVSFAFVYREKILKRFITWKGHAKIVLFGDSITAQGNWVALLGRADVVNSGLAGFCTYHFLGQLQDQVIEVKPKICFVMGGINDITVGVEQKKIQANYQIILEKLLENNITPIVTLTLYEQKDPVSKLEIIQLNNFLTKYCQQHRIEILDLNPFPTAPASIIASAQSKPFAAPERARCTRYQPIAHIATSLNNVRNNFPYS
jgi:lysophospholipase L1-like esterase